MPVVHTRRESVKAAERAETCGASIAILGTASHWNAEAILLAAKKLCGKYGIESVPVTVSMTFNYRYMAQAQRITYSGDPKLGFQSIMEHLHLLCGSPGSPYHHIQVLPHLDHADPEFDMWALTEGIRYLSSVMFDAQRYTREKNMELTREYVKNHHADTMVEGIMEELVVADVHGRSSRDDDDYPVRAREYVDATGVDYLVADLGTEQQAATCGNAVYLKKRAEEITAALGRKMLVLHGASSLTNEQMKGLAADGVVRVNMWTKIAREAGRNAARNLFERICAGPSGNFETFDSRQYLYDNIEYASNMMLEILETLNYANFAKG